MNHVRTPREELLDQKNRSCAFWATQVTLGEYDVNEKYFRCGGSSHETRKNSSWRTPRPKNLILCFFETQKVILGVSDVNKNIFDSVVVLMNHVRTPREDLLDPKSDLMGTYHHSDIFDEVVVLINHGRTTLEELFVSKSWFYVFQRRTVTWWVHKVVVPLQHMRAPRVELLVRNSFYLHHSPLN